MRVQLILRSGLPFAAAVNYSGGEVDHRPCQASQQSQSAGQVGQQQAGLLLPGQHGFDGELRQRLHPCEDGQSETLRDEKLRRFRAPGDQSKTRQDARGCPERRPWPRLR